NPHGQSHRPAATFRWHDGRQRAVDGRCGAPRRVDGAVRARRGADGVIHPRPSTRPGRSWADRSRKAGGPGRPHARVARPRGLCGGRAHLRSGLMARRLRPGQLMLNEIHEQPLVARAADWVWALHAGAGRSVAGTKTDTPQLMLLSLLVAHTAGNSRLIRAHEALPEAVARAVQTAPAVADAAALLQRGRECLVTSRGYNFATALEAALKLKESSRVVAEALS